MTDNNKVGGFLDNGGNYPDKTNEHQVPQQ
jgi:hypothetical protein